MRGALALVSVSVIVLLTACGDGGDGGNDGNDGDGGVERTIDNTVAGASVLSEIQLTASTVTPPLLPGLCDPADIEVVTVEPGDAADQVLNLVNRGTVLCEVDISESPNAGVDLEPNVVLAPDETARLFVSEAADCAGGPAASEFQLRINGSARLVPTAFEPQCQVELWAFFTD